MSQISCPHCTFLNDAGKVKCGMCLKMLKKRTRESSPSNSGNQTDSIFTQNKEESSKKALPDPADDLVTKERESQSDEMVNSSLFQTAGGHSVNVSKKALDLATAEFSGESLEIVDKKKSSEMIELPLFQTAGGSSIKVSKKALDVAAAKLDGESVAEKPKLQDLEVVQRGSFKPPFQNKINLPTEFAEASGAGKRYYPPPASVAEQRSLSLTSSYLESVRTKGVIDQTSDKEDGLDENASRMSTNKSTEEPLRVPLSVNSIKSINKGRRPFNPPKRIAEPFRKKDDDEAPKKMNDKEAVQSIVSTSNPRKLQFLRFDVQQLSSRTIEVPNADILFYNTTIFYPSDCSEEMKKSMKVTDLSAPIELCNWRHLLVSLGANSDYCCDSWCEDMIRSALFELLELSKMQKKSLVSATSVAILLCYKYNQEFMDGKRPILRKIMEGDMNSAVLVILYVSGIVEEKSVSLHQSIVYLSDGFYHVKVSLDLSLTSLVKSKHLYVGRKLGICGSKLLLASPCAPAECRNEVVLALNANCVRAVHHNSVLGAAHQEPQPIPLAQIDPQGGLVPVISGVITRRIPNYYITYDSTEKSGARIIRNSSSHFKYVSDIEKNLEKEEHGIQILQETIVTCVSSFTLKDSEGTEVLVQKKDKCSLRESTLEKEQQFPPEGSFVSLYCMRTTQFTPVPPFSKLQLLQAPSSFNLTIDDQKSLRLKRAVFASLPAFENCVTGQPVDVAGIFLDHKESDQGIFFLFLLQDHSYLLFQIPLPSARLSLSFSTPKAAGGVHFMLNCSFVSRIESDCVLVFASELTELGASTSRIENEAADALRALEGDLNGESRKIKSRSEELLLYSHKNSAQMNKTIDTVNARREFGSPDSNRIKAIPYYLRDEYKGKVPAKLQLKPPNVTPSIPISGSERFHFYGNICSVKLDGIELLDEHFLPDFSGASQTSKFDGKISISWMYGKLPSEMFSASVENPSLLNTIFDTFLPLLDLNCAPNNEENVTNERKRVIDIWKSKSPDFLWLNVFRFSKAIDIDSNETTDNFICWKKAEWKNILNQIIQEISKFLFKFTVSDSRLEKIFFISAACKVPELF